MSGLFLNFYQVDIPTKTASIDSVEYSKYASKEAFIALKESFPNLFFYRDVDNEKPKSNLFSLKKKQGEK